MEKKTSPDWEVFAGSEQVQSYIQDIERLFSPVLKKLRAGEIPFFYDYWYRMLNSHQIRRFTRGEETLAMTALPRVVEMHYQRWYDRVLAVNFESKESWKLPVDEDKVSYLMVPTDPDGRIPGDIVIENASFEPFQYCLTKRLEEPDFLPGNSDVLFRPLVLSDIEQAQSLVRSDFMDGSVPDFYLPVIVQNIRDCFFKNSGWCYCAFEPRLNRVIGFCLYLGFLVPLCGVPCAVVGDIVVHPDFRGKGVASCLQRFAYHDLQQKKVAWVCGNILASNRASLNMAGFLGREYWSVVLKVSPNIR